MAFDLVGKAVKNLRLPTVSYNNSPIKIIPAQEGDVNSRYFSVTLYDDRGDISLKNYSKATLNATLPDGKLEMSEGEINKNDNVAVCKIVSSMLSQIGKITCDILLTGKDANGIVTSLTSQTFYILATKSQASKDAVEGTDDYTLLPQLLNDIADLEKKVEDSVKAVNESIEELEEKRAASDLLFQNTANQLDSKISRNDERITNLEKGVPNEQFFVDDSVKNTKDVPENALPYAKINKIGGMTRKSANLIPYPYIHTTRTENGITFTDNGDGTITLNGTSTGTCFFVLAGNLNIPNGTYFISDSANKGASAYVRVNNAYFNTSFTVSGVIDSIELRVSSGVTFNNVTFKPMLNRGSTALPYEPYFEGLRSAPVTEVESVGANLIPFPYKFSSFEKNGVKFGIDAEQRITLYGTCSGSKELTFAELTLPIGSYTFSATQTSDYTRVVLTKNGTALRYQAKADNAYKFTVDSVTDIYAIEIVILSGNTYSNDIIAPMLNKGSTALPYRPYTKNTLAIPEAVRPKNGINENVYDYIDFEIKQSAQRVGVVDLGTLGWTKNSDGLYYAQVPNIKAVFYQIALLCGKYNYLGFANIAQMTQDKSCWNNINYVWFRGNEYADAATFKAAMSGVMLYYELAEPIITDISDILPSDNFIAVEGGGTLIFKNEFDYDVPSEVVYQLKEV